LFDVEEVAAVAQIGCRHYGAFPRWAFHLTKLITSQPFSPQRPHTPQQLQAVNPKYYGFITDQNSG
jgi:hypothetical protein